MSEEVEMLQGKELPKEESIIQDTDQVKVLAVDKEKFEMMEAFIAKYSDLELYIKDMPLERNAIFDQAVINFKQGMMWIKECIYLHKHKEEQKNA